MLLTLQQRRLLILTGKGGVGKTSLVAALGVAGARSGRRVLLAEVRSHRRIPLLLGHDVDRDGPLLLGPNLHWINFTPQAALEEYAMQRLRFRAVYRAVFEQQAVRRFLRVVPSLAEILILGYLVNLLEEGGFDLVILDAPSTGPGALLLEAPRAILESAPRGPLYEGAAWIQRALNDQQRTAIHLVVVPEELPVSEAIELFHHFRTDAGMPLGEVLVNRVLSDPFPPHADLVLTQIAGMGACPELSVEIANYRSRLSCQERYLDRLRAGVDLPAVYLPEVVEEQPTAQAVVTALAQAIGQTEGPRP